MFNTILIILQLFLTLVMGIYFFNMLRSQHNGKSGLESDSARELDKLRRLKQIHLTKPLSEKTRPARLDEVIGQEDGIRALRAAICGPNPQHVIIYGPPGIGKTAAARAVLQEAIASDRSPFRDGAQFVEMDATILRFDERGIADPLIGSVHDPIYQGAGAYGPAGVPQPKPGAVTKAHGGILFLDEIGELHPVQMNKLLKVLEDRMVFLESAYYASGNKDIPPHVHEIFQKGLPADFRLVGATTRSPDELPPALRSRCVEIFFSPLSASHIRTIALNAAQRGGFTIDKSALNALCQYAQNGRDAVNLMQTAGSVAMLENRFSIIEEDVNWVAESGRYAPRYEPHVADESVIGLVNGLAVSGFGQGALIDVEATASPAPGGTGSLRVTGIVESTELEGRGQKLIRNSSARASVQNMLTVLQRYFCIDISQYHLHINFPGGTPIDGPSAGCAIVTAVYSAITGQPVSNHIAMTGELSIHGKVKPVGGVSSKIHAAAEAGVKTVYIPAENKKNLFCHDDIQIVEVSHIRELFAAIFHTIPQSEQITATAQTPCPDFTIAQAEEYNQPTQADVL
ncbi:MAG: ATP-dependent protease LonB [Ruminococcaceae bacterium]|nr:ATP-dependent protease LonB [Oscillospiraceae bacterium]